ncbi:MAG: phosphatidate cytidylyltransferase [Chloroflexi bacterium]|nr:MAG: phosphatidate cytidylyltransferase [Chloroflexota bacterium]
MLQQNLFFRLLTGLVALPSLALVIWAGGLWFVAVASAVALVAGWEFHRLSRAANANSPLLLVLAFPPGLAVAAYFDEAALGAAIGGAFLVSIAFLFLKGRRRSSLRDYAFTLGGIAYVGIPLALAVMMRGASDGLAWVTLALAVAFASDASAYAVGRLIGRRLLAPSISAGKTWEGAVGGLVGAAITAYVVVALMDLPLPLWLAGAVGALLGVVGQLGDLAESKLKRSAGIKDASGLIPGHGGLLDRLDSVVFTLVAVYYVALGYW